MAEIKVVWSPEAETDLRSIWHWGATHFSPDIADSDLRDIDRAVANPAEFPHAGAARGEIAPGMRSIVVHPTVVFYRMGNASIDIILDGRRSLAALFPRNQGG